MKPELMPDNSRIVDALLAMAAKNLPLYGSYRGSPVRSSGSIQKDGDRLSSSPAVAGPVPVFERRTADE